MPDKEKELPSGKIVYLDQEIDSDDRHSSLELNQNEKKETKIKVQEVLPLTEAQITILLTIIGDTNPENTHELPKEIEFLLTKIQVITVEEALEELNFAVTYHFQDPNIPEHDYQDYIRYANNDFNPNDEDDIYKLKSLAVLLKWWSPYPEVRSVTDPVDDPDIPIETFRAYFWALLFTIVFSGFNEFFSHRLNAVGIGSSVVQMLLYPAGTAWAKYMPKWGIKIKGKKYAINIDHPWSLKEQMFATLLFGITGGVFYSSTNILTQTIKYQQELSFGYQFWLSFPLQFIGFGLAGILRRFVVFSSKAVWPSILPTLALNRALLKPDSKRSKGISPYNVFWIALGSIFVWTWVPQVLFNFLQATNWLNIVKPNNVPIAIWTGQKSGLGLTPLPFLNTFDWNYLGSMGPLVVPFFSLTNQIIGAIIATLIIGIIYYKNYQGCAYLPIMSLYLYDNKGEVYEAQQILDSKFQLDESKYQRYSPPYYSAGNIVIYGSFIALYPLLIIYSFITQWSILYGAFKDWAHAIWSLTKPSTYKEFFGDYKVLENFRDPHSRMMKKYKEVPDWWFFVILIASFIIAVVMLEVYKTNTPIWGLVMALGLNFVFLIPISILEATASFGIGLNLLIEMITGYALPGNPMASMFIKAFGYNIDGQSDNYISNLKMGHYAKIPPRALFRGQLIVVFLQIFVNLGVINWQRYNIKDFCSPHQIAKFTCPGITTFFNASIIWGALGPKRVFEGLYPVMKWCWLIGALLGVLFGVWNRWFPKYYPRVFNPLLVLGGFLSVGPPYNISYFFPSYFVGVYFMFYVKRWYLPWWEKYNYVLLAGLSCGLSFASLVIFFAVQYKNYNIEWWGNTVANQNLDGTGELTLKNVTELSNGFFGPAPGHYP